MNKSYAFALRKFKPFSTLNFQFSIINAVIFFSIFNFQFSISDAQQTADTLSAAKKSALAVIPGTHLSMLIPPGFRPAKDFFGIEKDDKTYIKVSDPYESNYKESSEGFTRPVFESKGMDVFMFKSLHIDGYSAKYAGMNNSSGYRKYELLFGDTGFSALLIANCSVNDDAVCKGIENALLSVNYNKNIKINPYIHAYFKVNDSVSAFKFSKVSDKVYNYSLEGNIKPGEGEPVLTITPFTVDAPMTDKDIKKTLEGIYKAEGMTSINVKNETDKEINGYTAYESEIYGKLNGKQTMIYQVTLFNNEKALLIMGISRDNMDNNLSEFKKLAYTVNFK